MYREAGGKRAVIADIFTDLRPTRRTLLERAKVTWSATGEVRSDCAGSKEIGR